MGFTRAVIPITEPILNILEPIKLPSEIDFSFLTAAMIEVAISGMLVPTATTLIEIILSDILNLSAILIAPSINSSEPPHKATPPIKNHKTIFKFEDSVKLSSISSIPTPKTLAFLIKTIIKTFFTR